MKTISNEVLRYLGILEFDTAFRISGFYLIMITLIEYKITFIVLHNEAKGN